VRGMLAGPNKGDALEFHLARGLPDTAPIILAELSCPGRLCGELHRVFHAWRSLDRMRFGPPHSCFYLTVWFQREHCEALLVVTIMRHDSRSMVKSLSVRMSWKMRSGE
jgi:hypothetical protein